MPRKPPRRVRAVPLAPDTPYPCRPHENTLLGTVVPGRGGGVISGCATPSKRHPTEGQYWIGLGAAGRPMRKTVAHRRLVEHGLTQPGRHPVEIETHAASCTRAVRAGEARRPCAPGLEFPHRPASSPCVPSHPVWVGLEEAIEAHAIALETVPDGMFEALLVQRLQMDPRYPLWLRTEEDCLRAFATRQKVRAPKATQSGTREAAQRRAAAVARGEDTTAAAYRDTLAAGTRARAKSRRNPSLGAWCAGVRAGARGPRPVVVERAVGRARRRRRVRRT